MENDNFHLLWIFLFLSVIFLFTWFISLYRERKARKTEKICIYCGEALHTWGAEHPLKCGLRHPRLSLQGTFSHLLSELSRTLGLIALSDFFIRLRDSAEASVKELGKKRRERRSKR